MSGPLNFKETGESEDTENLRKRRLKGRPDYDSNPRYREDGTFDVDMLD